MTNKDLEERRVKVSRLLLNSIDRKLLKGGSNKALEWAVEAYELAKKDVKLLAPWPQLTAYRLAHLKSRIAESSVGNLEEIDVLFTEASTTPELKAIASAYRVAVLTRLEFIGPDSSRCRWQEKRSDCFREALQAIRHAQLNPNVLTKESIPIQTTAFNLLEFSSYLLGLPYDDLEGLGMRDTVEHQLRGGWFIAGSGIERIRMTEEFARCEFRARAAASSGLFIELNKNFASWRLGGDDFDSEPESVNPGFAKLVLLSLEQPSLTLSDLRRRTVGTGGEDYEARFRQVKTRTQKAIRKLFKDRDLSVFDVNGFNKDIRVIGLVESAAFR
jgi:hypothetical protein